MNFRLLMDGDTGDVTIINLEHIVTIKTMGAGGSLIVLRDGGTITLPNSSVSDTLKALGMNSSAL